MEKVEKSRIFALKELGYDRNCLAIESMHKKEMAERTKELRKVDRAGAAGCQSSRRQGCGSCD